MNIEKVIKISPCPCGKVPKELFTLDGKQGGKYDWVYGSCCGEWNIEFRTNYEDPRSTAYTDLAREAWNNSPRG